jgi:hypothetical protein
MDIAADGLQRRSNAAAALESIAVPNFGSL